MCPHTARLRNFSQAGVGIVNDTGDELVSVVGNPGFASPGRVILPRLWLSDRCREFADSISNGTENGDKPLGKFQSAGSAAAPGWQIQRALVGAGPIA